MKRLKRTPALQISLEIKDDDFINPPTPSQRNGLVNKALKEFVDDLEALHDIAGQFVSGGANFDMSDRTQKTLSEQEIMEDWQIPIMQKMADLITAKGGDILEIDFGRGISSDMIQAKAIQSHTIIECNDFVVKNFWKWKEQYAEKDIRLVHGLWQDTIDDLGLFDGIFFHTYPLNEEEYMKYVHGRVTFAEHFFATAAAHLKPGGSFTYFSNEIDSLSRSHQRALFEHFSAFSMQIVPLQLPENVQDTWWANKMAVVEAVR